MAGGKFAAEVACMVCLADGTDMAARKLVFRKGAASLANDAAHRMTENAPKRINIGEHPLFERIRGTAHVSEGVDLTEPACPEWADLIDETMPLPRSDKDSGL